MRERRDGVWEMGSVGVAGEKRAVPPEPFLSARRMTPVRSGQLQRAVSAGEAELSWEEREVDGKRVSVRTVRRVGEATTRP